MSATPALPRPATTIIVLREREGELQVFLVQRHRKSGFLPSAWVFPGGRVDPSDRLHSHPRVLGGGELVARMKLEDEVGTAILVAGVRETFEEAGVWLGSGSLPWSLRAPLQSGEVKLADVLEEHDATINLDALGLWSWWVTPTNEPRRYDTRFLVAVSDQEGRHDEHETVDSGWFKPREVLEGIKRGKFPMAPPTWWTLKELAELGGLAAVRSSLRVRPHREILPILSLAPGAISLTLPGHPSHPDPAIAGLPARLGYRDGTWWVESETQA